MDWNGGFRSKRFHLSQLSLHGFYRFISIQTWPFHPYLWLMVRDLATKYRKVSSPPCRSSPAAHLGPWLQCDAAECELFVEWSGCTFHKAYWHIDLWTGVKEVGFHPRLGSESSFWSGAVLSGHRIPLTARGVRWAWNMLFENLFWTPWATTTIRVAGAWMPNFPNNRILPIPTHVSCHLNYIYCLYNIYIYIYTYIHTDIHTYHPLPGSN